MGRNDIKPKTRGIFHSETNFVTHTVLKCNNSNIKHKKIDFYTQNNKKYAENKKFVK